MTGWHTAHSRKLLPTSTFHVISQKRKANLLIRIITCVRSWNPMEQFNARIKRAWQTIPSYTVRVHSRRRTWLRLVSRLIPQWNGHFVLLYSSPLSCFCFAVSAVLDLYLYLSGHRVPEVFRSLALRSRCLVLLHGRLFINGLNVSVSWFGRPWWL